MFFIKNRSLLMAVYSVYVAQKSKVNFKDGIENNIWGFTDTKKLFPKGQPNVNIGDLVLFFFGLHQSKDVAKGGFPRVKDINTFLYHYKPYADVVTIARVEEVFPEHDNSKVMNGEGAEIWGDTNEGEQHKFGYRIKINPIQTFDSLDLITKKLNPLIVNALRLSSADIGSLRYALDEELVFDDKDYYTPEERNTGKPLQKASSKLVSNEAFNNKQHTRKATSEGVSVRRESLLVEDYCTFLINNIDPNFKHLRDQITLPNNINLYTDISYGSILIEAKASSDRSSIRTAIGQLFDYEYLLEKDLIKTVLLPTRPEDSLCQLLATLKFNIIYKHNETFKTLINA